MNYDDRIKEQVQSASDIVDVISQYIPLKRTGRNFKAVCPFHQEKSPSFMVHPEKQIFRCFGCGAGGDVFAFIMRHENLNFPEALRQLADRARITLPAHSQSFKSAEATTQNEKLYEIYHEACQFYHSEYRHPVNGKKARDYFLKRHFDEAFAEAFKIGWAPEDWQRLYEYLLKKKFSEEIMLKSGLIHKSPKGRCYDAFRGRLLFPIQNLQGKVVAFGGRILSAEKTEGPKYLNSPENPIFHKREELFGLYLAKKAIDRDRPQIFVTEGYFDFLRLYQHGFKAAVATLGTSLTDQHVRMLKRFAEEAVVVYDGDKAGQAASLRGLEVFLEGGMNVKLVRMPEGYDPDDYLDRLGPEAFQKLTETAQDFFDFKLEFLLEKFDRWDSLGLMRITGEFLDTLAKVKNSFLLDRYLRKLAASLGIDENSLRKELGKLKDKTAKPAVAPGTGRTKPPAKKASQDEILMLNLFIDEPSLREGILTHVQETDFNHEECRKLFQDLAARYRQGTAFNWPQVLSQIPSDEFKSALLGPTVFEWSKEDKEKAFEDCLKKIKGKQHQIKLDQLRRQIAQAEKEQDSPRVKRFVEEYQVLLKSKL